MSHTVTINDETTTGHVLHSMDLEFLTERVTVRELIRTRVYQEVKDFNVERFQTWNGLVQPEEVEKTLNRDQNPRDRKIDWQKQFDKAIKAFETRQLLILVGDRQLTELDDEIEVGPETQISFLKLVLLVGG